jgi:hypothetical protein
MKRGVGARPSDSICFTEVGVTEIKGRHEVCGFTRLATRAATGTISARRLSVLAGMADTANSTRSFQPSAGEPRLGSARAPGDFPRIRRR